MRYTLFFTSSLFPFSSYLLRSRSVAYGLSPCSLLPKNQKFVPHRYKTCYISPFHTDSIHVSNFYKVKSYEKSPVNHVLVPGIRSSNWW
ncbi:hypothetical protein [Moorena producens]|uniref:hypothetical protein n=1 Tax=Moorena producens TaxID=1155739 RepID=UPI0011EA7089|nr:hypothetical protein [Moorena producens]